ncbi:hypothetical protein CCHR01_06162 [Colletotrichum chrysophilum]|uniref:Uncharacterized protein n=1 Tax=Colletotrichum chrysophilum TaxID=1836956 RepID=A0AAD9AQ93_9PEZI|nr:hypothetical protein CCHR01_06162 [Colletotrichum chrysophilum]
MWNDKGSSRHNDFYRNNTQHLRTDEALNGQKMPPTAPFNVQDEHGKALDKRAERLDNDVNHEWHDGAAERLDEASRTWKAAGDARQKTAHDFIGYDSLQGHKGHQKRIQRCYLSGDKRALAAESHRKAFA